jgi:hypothetical protein
LLTLGVGERDGDGFSHTYKNARHA